MAKPLEKNDEAFVQLATRIPKSLHRQLKLHCVSAGTSLMDFVIASLREHLAHAAKAANGRRKRAA